MADIRIVSRLIAGIHRDIDLQQNSLVVGSLKVGATSPTELTKAILDRLVSLQNGSDVNSSYHTHDTRYNTETEMSSTSGTSGAQLVGVKGTPTNHTPATPDAQGYFDSIDAALLSAGGSSFSDASFEIVDNTTPSKKIKFEASGISTSTTRTVTMPDANVDLGALTNSNISASAAIALSKLAAVTANRALVSDASGYATASTTTDTEIGYVSGVTSSIQSQLGAKLALAGGTMSGNIAMGNNKVTGLFAGSANNDAVNYAQLTAIAAGVVWLDPIKDPDLVDDSLLTQPVSPAYGDLYIATKTAGDWTVNRAYFSLDSGTTWTDLLGRAVIVGDRFGVSMETPTSGAGGLSAKDNQIAQITTVAAKATIVYDTVTFTADATGTSGNSIALVFDGIDDLDTVVNAWNSANPNDTVSFTGQAGSYVPAAGTATLASGIATAYSFTIPTANKAIYVNEPTSHHSGHQYNFNGTSWVEFGGLDAITSGIGLLLTGNTLSVNMGAGIVQLPSDEVGVDVHADGGLMTTVDNSSSSTATAAQLAVKLDGSTLSKGASGLKVAALGITDAEVSASAAIAYSKLNLSTSIVNGDINGSAAIAYSKLNLSSSIVNADIATGAAIAYSKLALSNSITNADITTGVADQSTIVGGNGTALSVDHAPVLKGSEVAGESFAASLFAVRYAKAADAGFVAGRVYKSDIDASVNDNFYVVGLVNSAASAGGAITATKVGPITVTGHGFTIGAPLFLDASGAVTATAPSAANMAVVRVGFAKTANIIEVQIQVIGVN
jgi:hypothetical protein